MGCTSKSREKYNVVFISLDSTRNDHTDTGKGARAYTPELKRFSEKSIVFENAFTTCTQTLPSHLSIFTSRYPHELGVYSNDDKYDGRYKMIQQKLNELGYHTASIISLGTLNSATGTQHGFKEFREDLIDYEVFFVPAEKITSEAINTIQKIKKEKFFLFVHYSDPHTPYAPPGVEGDFEVYLDGHLISHFDSYKGSIIKKSIPLIKGSHLMEFKVNHDMEDFCHFVIRGLSASEGCSLIAKNLDFSEELYGGSYKMKDTVGQIEIQCDKEGFVRIFQIIPILKAKSASQLYRLEVEYMDKFVGIFLRAFEEVGLQDKTIVVLFADHGEGHGERENFFGHTKFLNSQFIHVPLIMKVPGYDGKRIDDPISLVGVSPTVLELLGIQDKSFNHRESFTRAIQERPYEDRLIYSFAFEPSVKIHKLSLIKWPFQSIFYLDQGKLQRQEYYNLAISQSFNERDAVHEDTILKATKKHYDMFLQEFSQMRDIFRIANTHAKGPAEKNLEKLKALGYVND